MRTRVVMGVSVIVVSTLAAAAAAKATPAFWTTWGDGKAELSGYRITTGRYGAPREGSLVLIYVTEPMDRRVWIKDDTGDVPPSERVNVMKLNAAFRFQTGIYPYSVMTSVFAPVDGPAALRFTPAKIAMTSQEWCGSVYHKLVVRDAAFDSEIHSYFHAEGDRAAVVPTRPGTIYEDALLLQLRELDGPFAAGRDWSGAMVPTLWSSRKTHRPLRPVLATIRRASAVRDGVPVTRFTVAYGAVTKTIDVEKEGARRVLGWTTSDGETASILKTARLAYWKLNAPGDEKYLSEIGLQ